MNQQSVRQAAPRSALDAQAVLRYERADQERRPEGRHEVPRKPRSPSSREKPGTKASPGPRARQIRCPSADRAAGAGLDADEVIATNQAVAAAAQLDPSNRTGSISSIRLCPADSQPMPVRSLASRPATRGHSGELRVNTSLSGASPALPFCESSKLYATPKNWWMPGFDARESRTDAGMVTTEAAEATASETRPPGFRIRWGWFLGCIASGLVAIVVGWFVATPAGRINYLAEIFAGVGTTLLLLGIVVLLERRIVDNAVRRFRNAAEEAWARISGRFPHRGPGLHGSRERRVGRRIAGGCRRDEGADQTPLQGAR
jgi:hypothetical protein